jgi:hypothetical protein
MQYWYPLAVRREVCSVRDDLSPKEKKESEARDWRGGFIPTSDSNGKGVRVPIWRHSYNTSICSSLPEAQPDLAYRKATKT